MTKGELVKTLEPFIDEIEIYRPRFNRDGERDGEVSITQLNYSYDVSNTTGTDGVGKIVLD